MNGIITVSPNIMVTTFLNAIEERFGVLKNIFPWLPQRILNKPHIKCYNFVIS